MSKFTKEQLAAIESKGKVIVSASAGSGKTTVMIEKLVNEICGGLDLDEVLAMTFTKKAAAQMKEKLRDKLVERMEREPQTRKRLKEQLNKIPTADISTIHSFCSKLVRTYFYLLDIDGGFDIISSDDVQAAELKNRALDAVFERRYADNDEDFRLLLKCFCRKRSDRAFRELTFSAYDEVRSKADYEKVLQDARGKYTEQTFYDIVDELSRGLKPRYERLLKSVNEFELTFPITRKADEYTAIFGEMRAALTCAANGKVTDPKPPFTVTKKPTDAKDEKWAGEEFKAFRDGAKKVYDNLVGDYRDEQTELFAFLESGRVAAAFSELLLQFDREYTAVKREESKLDYNDLEHLTLKLLQDKELKEEIRGKYSYVFVDEYQDVNPVQEEIISVFGGNVFLVGDVKQAIYGFRGSKSEYFAKKFENFKYDGSALKLSSNFRSSEGVLNFVNDAFSQIMTAESCGIDYAGEAQMVFGGGYPAGYGKAEICVFGKDEKEERELTVYSVCGDDRRVKQTREGRAVVALVKEALKSQHHDGKKLVPTQAGDICILTRKNVGASTEGIARALRDAGYSVSGVQEINICELSEGKQFLDILSFIDNSEQDIPLITCMLSPIGGFTEDELARIRIVCNGKTAFRESCRNYCKVMPGAISNKIRDFGRKINKLKELSQILTVGELADEILSAYGLEHLYSAGGGEKLKNVLRLINEGADLPLPDYLERIRAGGYEVLSTLPAASDSIKIMSMHAAKGLEFPVVIISDICRKFKGRESREMLFDDKIGFAPKYYDVENMLTAKTVLRRLVKLKTDAEELKNEMNLFYVACTRAMCKLYIMTEEIKTRGGVETPVCYADMLDLSRFTARDIDFAENEENGVAVVDANAAFDGVLAESIAEKFMLPYAHEDSVELPVKSSVSAIIRLSDDEATYIPKNLFSGEGETNTAIGTAYHRFLELCDFSIKTKEGIERELENFAGSGRLTHEQLELLNPSELVEIVNMPVFSDLAGAELYREREFLCNIPAKYLFDDCTAGDNVLVQGAVDLFAHGEFGTKIIDYKYSRKDDESLVRHYKKQLELYKRAASVITGDSPETIKTVIVNIFLKRQINLD